MVTLRTKREQAIDDLAQAKNDREDAERRKKARETDELELRNRQAQLDDEKRKPHPNATYVTQLSDMIEKIQTRLRSMPEIPDLDRALVKANYDLQKKKDELSKIEADLTRKLDIERMDKNFRMSIAAGFAGALLVVFISLLIVIVVNRNMREQALTSRGLLTVVLSFVLLMTVALVGVLGTLESKDLSGLLAAIVGYLLGRVEKKADKPGDQGGQEPK